MTTDVKLLLLIAALLSSTLVKGDDDKSKQQQQKAVKEAILRNLDKNTTPDPATAARLIDKSAMNRRDAMEDYLMQEISSEEVYFNSLPTIKQKREYLKEWEKKTINSAEKIVDVFQAASSLAETVEKAGVKVKNYEKFMTNPPKDDYRTYVTQKAYQTDRKNGQKIVEEFNKALDNLYEATEQKEEEIAEWNKNKIIYGKLSALCPECAKLKID